jgi:hypothetical protein
VSDSPYVIESLDAFMPDALFLEGRDQVLVAARVTPVYGRLDLSVVGAVVEEANARGLMLVRETPFRDEYLLLVFEAYDE